MKVTITTKDPDGYHDYEFVKIDFDGRQQFYVEEDKKDFSNNTLNNNFAACRFIHQMLEKVYIAGQKGEDLEFEHIQV